MIIMLSNMNIEKYNKQKEFKVEKGVYMQEWEKEYDFPEIPWINKDFLTDINVKI